MARQGTFLRKHSRITMVLGVIVLCASLSAYTLSNLVQAAVAPLKYHAPPRALASSSLPPALPDAGLYQLWERASPTPVAPFQQVPQPEEPSSLGAAFYPVMEGPTQLSGTIVFDAGQSAHSLAMFQDGGRGYSRAEGQWIRGVGQVVKIERERVIIRQKGELKQLVLVGSPAGRRLPPAQPAAGASREVAKRGQKGGVRAHVKKTGTNAYTLDRSYLKKVAERPTEVLAGVKPTPYVRAGKVQGFRMDGIRSGSLLYEMGLRAGDVIDSIDGKPLRGPSAAMQLLQRFTDGEIRGLKLGIGRRGTRTSISYTIR